MKKPFGVVVMTGLALALASSSGAQEIEVRAFGLRGGINVNPDQFNFGFHVDAGQIASHVRFQPSVEVGLGNGVRLIAANFDAHYRFRPRRWRPYAGGGLGLNFIDVTSGVGAGNGLDLEPAVNLVGGVEWGTPHRGSRASSRYLLEGRVGVGNTPDLKLVAGITF